MEDPWKKKYNGNVHY